MQKITLDALAKYKKEHKKIVAITAYDALMASIFDEIVDVILVGDSLNMSFNAKHDTLGLSVRDMLYHTKAVCSGAKRAFIIADMPFGSYPTKQKALKNALRFYTQTRCDALKLEINEDKLEIIESLVKEGFAVMAHIGLCPQSVRGEGGYKVKGRDSLNAKNLLNLAKECEHIGAFGILLEGITKALGAEISKSLSIPTIGIGAGVHCDGQILVWSDAFGFFDAFKPKFVRRYLNGKELLQNTLKNYASDVIEGRFPNDEESY